MLPAKPMPESLRNAHIPLFRDPPDLIGRALGGREFFFNVGASSIHRCGILLGLGFRIPFGEAKDFIDCIRVYAEEGKPTFRMEFLKYRQKSDPPEYDLVRQVEGVKECDIRKTYDENT